MEMVHRLDAPAACGAGRALGLSHLAEALAVPPDPRTALRAGYLAAETRRASI